ncbi:nucleoside diphosphate kinase [Kipferlia bialata]|uniref:nucleoside-diphosphate kinase n=1 Tax=Kipferlia bialata TaxID=797122 RepID=A0A9K3CXX5_9EUKA|nr:nucleoside diphosphate kinase [Kipferlia bialata]|eukprot:g7033.t1
METTYLMVKPDGVQRGLVGEIISRFEKRFQLVGLKMVHPTKETVESHYAEHAARPFFGSLVDFLTSGPVVAMAWRGNGCIAACRTMIGATKPLESAPGMYTYIEYI